MQNLVHSLITVVCLHFDTTENVFVYVRHQRLVTFVFERLINIRLLLLLLLLHLQTANATKNQLNGIENSGWFRLVFQKLKPN